MTEQELPAQAQSHEEGSGAVKQPVVPSVPDTPKPIEAEVRVEGQPPTKVTVTPVDVAQDGKEATVKVSVSEGEPAEQTPNLAPLLFVAAVAALVLVTSSRTPAGPSPQ